VELKPIESIANMKTECRICKGMPAINLLYTYAILPLKITNILSHASSLIPITGIQVRVGYEQN